MNTTNMVRQLAHLKQKSISNSSCKSIIVDTLLASDSALSVDDLVVEIHSLFQVLISKDRLRQILGSLSTEHVVQIDANQNIDLSPAKKVELLSTRAVERKLQQQAINNWLDYIRDQKELSIDLASKLTGAIPVFLRKLFIRHGVSSYELLSNAKSELSLDITEIAEEVSKSFDKQYRCELAGLLPTIFQHIDDVSINQYLVHCVKKAVGYLSEVVSDENYALLTSALEKLTLYLDTNVLYRLLRLQGKARYESIVETLNFCRTNNVTLRISAATKKEFSARLQFDSKVLIDHPIKTDLASLGYRYRSSDNYISSYWEQASTTGISVEDYIQYYQNFDVLLEAEGVDIENLVVDEVNLIERANSLYSILSARDRNYRKGDATLWHDAYSLAYVQKMQKADAKNAIDTGCLFLTTDQSIMAAQREDRGLKSGPVIAIVPSQLLQMFAFTRPDEGYEETFIKFFASSSIGVSFDYENEDIQEILSRISHYDTKTPEVAQKILARELFSARYKDAGSEEEKEEIIYKEISDELLKELNVSKEHLEKLHTSYEAQTQELSQAKETITEVKKQHKEESQSLKRQLEDERKSREEAQVARQNAEERNNSFASTIAAQEEYVVDKKMKSWTNKKKWLLAIGVLLSVAIIGTTIYLTLKKGVGWLALLGLLAAPIPMICSGAKAFSSTERENTRKATTEEYRREIEKKTWKNTLN